MSDNPPQSNQPRSVKTGPSGYYEAPQGGGYGYGGYGGYGYGGYGYGGQGGPGGYGYGNQDDAQHRSIKDYLLIFRERIWYFIVTFALILAGSIIYTYNATEIFQSVATLEILRDDINPLGQIGDEDPNEIRGTEDLNTQIGRLESIAVIEKVNQRLTPDERTRFMAPYRDATLLSGALTPIEVLGENREVSPFRLSRMVAVSYSHPDREIAARVANLFAEEFMNYNLSNSIDDTIKTVEDLETRSAQQRDEVERIRSELAEFRERSGSVSLDKDENIALQEMARLNELAVMEKSNYDQAATLWDQIQEYRDSGRNLWEIEFIARDPQVANLLVTVSSSKIEISSLSKRYRDKHPQMIAAREALAQAEKELSESLQSSVQVAYSNYQASRNAYEQAQARLDAQEDALIELSKLKVKYESLEADLAVQELFYQDLNARLSKERTQVNIKNPNVLIVDRAFPASKPSSPNVILNVALGLVGGTGCGIGLVFLIAFLDDRVKTAFDIEGVVGLPLIGIVPRIKRLDASEKAQAVASNQDRHVTEAFRSIHSTLRLNDDSRDARVILNTSTVPGEGKSFVSTNLALTYATHGEKVLLLDGDLRLPNVAKSLQIQVDKGIVTYFQDGGDIDDCIIKELYPNLDVLPAGAKAKNPTQILNNPKLVELIQDLRKRYTKIIIDTPPLVAVSDTLALLPHADGVVYVAKFNTVKRKTAKLNVRRLLDSNTPVFGAILNNINLNISSYYYSHYYDSSYKDYYVDVDEQHRSKIMYRKEEEEQKV